LESLKGRKIPENYYRKPRKHGAKAAKPGLSNEQICVEIFQRIFAVPQNNARKKI
jgi:hypothetical protein